MAGAVSGGRRSRVSEERQIFKEFADTYGVDVKYLYRYAFAIAHEVAEPEVEYLNPSEYKGRKFEEFVVSLCADKSRFRLLAWRGDKIVDGTYAAENLLPDLHIRHKLDNGKEVEYYIECKYRSVCPKEGIDLTAQLKRYWFDAIKKGIELFIALGVGGTPSNPDNLYLIPGKFFRRDDTHIKQALFKFTSCPKDAEGFHNYIDHFYQKRVF